MPAHIINASIKMSLEVSKQLTPVNNLDACPLKRSLSIVLQPYDLHRKSKEPDTRFRLSRMDTISVFSNLLSV